MNDFRNKQQIWKIQRRPYKLRHTALSHFLLEQSSSGSSLTFGATSMSGILYTHQKGRNDTYSFGGKNPATIIPLTPPRLSLLLFLPPHSILPLLPSTNNDLYIGRNSGLWPSPPLGETSIHSYMTNVSTPARSTLYDHGSFGRRLQQSKHRVFFIYS